jgi:uncharacterized protein with FMN-binding domain
MNGRKSTSEERHQQDPGAPQGSGTPQGSGVSRRQFLGSAGALFATALGGTALSACTTTAKGVSAGLVPYHESIVWDAEYDAVVVGFGLAGATTAVVAADSGAGKVLLLEKAPYGEEGGNSKVCEQYCLSWDSVEAGVKYMTAMSEGFASATPELIEFMAQGGYENLEFVRSLGLGEIENVLDTSTARSRGKFEETLGPVIYADYEIGEWAVQRDDGSISFGEYPVLPDGTWSNGLSYWGQLGGKDNEEKRLWKGMRQQVIDRADTIDVWLESPATALIQDPQTKTILGVQVNRKGTVVCVRALNGVALTCASYEANKALVETFAQRGETYPIGSLHNTGDGLIMAMSAGAEMWHMNALSGPWLLPKMPDADRCYFFGKMRNRWLAGAECIHVDSRAKRFGAEHGWHKHGHLRVGDTMQSQQLPQQAWGIYNIEADLLGDVSKIDQSLVFAASSPEELAEQIGLDPATLAKTIADYNEYCQSGLDREFLRDPRTLAPLDTGKLQAVRLYPCIVNSQAGPRRNAKCEVLDPEGNPIPGLYSAGELGSFWAGVYECGGNVAECLYTGRAAGAGLTAKKDIPEAVAYTKVESDPSLSGNDLIEAEQGASQVTLGENEYLGTAEGLHGPVRVKVRYREGALENIEIVEQHETPELTKQVWSGMPVAMVTANSTNVDTVSGATTSSHALIKAVEDAISQA